MDNCTDLSQSERDFISAKIMELCLREIMEFRYMQTDPNWANFFYNRNTKQAGFVISLLAIRCINNGVLNFNLHYIVLQIILLDFGATREYSKQFIDTYIKIIRSTIEEDREAVLHYSRQLGFLTGYESKVIQFISQLIFFLIINCFASIVFRLWKRRMWML